MFHLYSGSGTVHDTSNKSRAIRATLMISDQLETWGSGLPVPITPGQPIPNGKYQFRISDWTVAVDSIGTFFGQTGSLYIEFVPPTFPDRMWNLFSDASPEYSWIGQILSSTQPTDWSNPLAPDYGHLSRGFVVAGTYMGNSIKSLFSNIPQLKLTRV
jgi:hypothetical protein